MLANGHNQAVSHGRHEWQVSIGTRSGGYCRDAFGGVRNARSGKIREQDYGPTEGKEIAPGVRVVEVGKWDSIMTGMKSIVVIDVVFKPGAADEESVIDNDMLCQITSGEFKIKKRTRNLPSRKGLLHRREGSNGSRHQH